MRLLDDDSIILIAKPPGRSLNRAYLRALSHEKIENAAKLVNK